MKLWRDEGYIPSDSLYSGADAQAMFNNGEMFLQWTSVSPGTLHLVEKKEVDFDEILVAMTPNRNYYLTGAGVYLGNQQLL